MESRSWTARLKQPSWRDPRLMIGLVLVAASCLGCWRLVTVARHTTTVYSAAVDLPAGTPVHADDVTPIEVKLSTAGGQYLGADDAWPSGLVVLRSVTAGELIPAAAVGPAKKLAQRPVVVQVDEPIADGVTAGAHVDLWAAKRKAKDKPADPELVASGVRVVSVHRPKSGFGYERTAGVELLVDKPDIASVLQLVADEAKISLLVVPGHGGKAHGRSS